jgi:hypothetical protein
MVLQATLTELAQLMDPATSLTMEVYGHSEQRLEELA